MQPWDDPECQQPDRRLTPSEPQPHLWTEDWFSPNGRMICDSHLELHGDPCVKCGLRRKNNASAS